jgi:hypothetical protein
MDDYIVMARPIGYACGLPLKPPSFKVNFSYTHRKLYGGDEIYLRSFLPSISVGYQWLASRLIPLTFRDNTPVALK